MPFKEENTSSHTTFHMHDIKIIFWYNRNSIQKHFPDHASIKLLYACSITKTKTRVRESCIGDENLIAHK